MAIDNKYGSVNVPGIPDDEPVFILRAQDVLALPTILHYASMILGLDRFDDKMPAELRIVARQFSNWTGKRKLAD